MDYFCCNLYRDRQLGNDYGWSVGGRVLVEGFKWITSNRQEGICRCQSSNKSLHRFSRKKKKVSGTKRTSIQLSFP
jgi:hypothetical protein